MRQNSCALESAAHFERCESFICFLRARCEVRNLLIGHVHVLWKAVRFRVSHMRWPVSIVSLLSVTRIFRDWFETRERVFRFSHDSSHCHSIFKYFIEHSSTLIVPHRRMGNSVKVMPFNGEVQNNEEATVCVAELDLFMKFKEIDNIPTVLSIGQFCEDYGLSHEWTSAPLPILFINDGRRQVQYRELPADRCPRIINGLIQLNYKYSYNIVRAGRRKLYHIRSSNNTMCVYKQSRIGISNWRTRKNQKHK